MKFVHCFCFPPFALVYKTKETEIEMLEFYVKSVRLYYTDPNRLLKQSPQVVEKHVWEMSELGILEWRARIQYIPKEATLTGVFLQVH